MKVTKKARKKAKGMNAATRANFKSGRTMRSDLIKHGRTFNKGIPYVNQDNF